MLHPVLATLNSHLLTAKLGVPLLFENVREDTVATTFIKVFFQPAEILAAGISPDSQVQGKGFYELIIFSPSGRGHGEILKLGDKISAHFKINSLIQYDGCNVHVTSQSRTAGYIEGNNYRMTLSIYWTVFS